MPKWKISNTSFKLLPLSECFIFFSLLLPITLTLSLSSSHWLIFAFAFKWTPSIFSSQFESFPLSSSWFHFISFSFFYEYQFHQAMLTNDSCDNNNLMQCCFVETEFRFNKLASLIAFVCSNQFTHPTRILSAYSSRRSRL